MDQVIGGLSTIGSLVLGASGAVLAVAIVGMGLAMLAGGALSLVVELRENMHLPNRDGMVQTWRAARGPLALLIVTIALDLLLSQWGGGFRAGETHPLAIAAIALLNMWVIGKVIEALRIIEPDSLLGDPD